MKKGGEVPKTIDEYIATWPADIKQNGYLVYFAAFNNHIGFFPVPSGMKAFEKELSKFKTGKGSVQFPYDQPLPLALVAKIVKFRVQENMAKAEAKKKKVK
jgi:uncharacterized protein YdhG (YjbR/CyaY superfamily)